MMDSETPAVAAAAAAAVVKSESADDVPNSDNSSSPILNEQPDSLSNKSFEEWENNRKALERMLQLAAAFQNPLSFAGGLGGLNGLAGGGTTGTLSTQQQDDEGDEPNDDSPNSVEPEDLSFKMAAGRSGSSPGGTSDGGLGLSIDAPNGGDTPAHSWSYEEQFKQLYELNDDPKRKQWLDDWLSFMHKIGKPVTRIPIMAKQVLDLYELYRLVVSHGGLVEIIKKKLWREITKGLNLPSSITSAAFTLRTQYQKYLYDYECDREHLSQASELQKAIDENRREGRRQTQNFTPYSVPPTMIAARVAEDNNNNMNGGNSAALVAAYRDQQMAAIETQRHLERAQRAAVEALQKQQAQAQAAAAVQSVLNSHHHGHQASGRASTSSMSNNDDEAAARSVESSVPPPPSAKRPKLASSSITANKLSHHGSSSNMHSRNNVNNINNNNGSAYKSPGIDDPPMLNGSGSNAGLLMEPGAGGGVNDQMAALTGLLGMSNAHIKMTSRGDGAQEQSMVVSMEINGVMYQGVLFALGSAGAATTPGGSSSSNGGGQAPRSANPTQPLRIHTAGSN